MSFDLFGFDFLKSDQLFGVWLATFRDWEDLHRSFFCLYYGAGEWRVEFLWVRVF